MQTLKHPIQICKSPLLIFAAVMTCAGVIGCDTGDKPSKMVEMRGKMMKQREEMKNKGMGNSVPSAPSSGQSGQ